MVNIKRYYSQVCQCPYLAENLHPSLEELESYLESCKIITFQLVDYLDQISSTCAYRGNRPIFTKLTNRVNHSGKPFVAQKSTPSVSPLQQVPLVHGYIDSQFRFPKRIPTQRPCASVQPTRIGQNVSSLPPQLEFPPQTLAPMQVIPHMAVNPTMITAPTSPLNSDQNGKTFHLAAMPVAIVDATGNQTGTATIVTPQPIAVGPPFPTITQLVPENASPTEVASFPQIVPPLPSEEDQFIPFADHPFVSKYGPISRAMNIINSPSIVGSSNGIISNSGGTQSTNVILGRSAVPSLTFIQPLQQVVLTTIVSDMSGQPTYSSVEDTVPNSGMLIMERDIPAKES